MGKRVCKKEKLLIIKTKIMTQRTQEAIDVFLDALNEGTLAKGTCTACAVGNLAAFGMGVKITKNKYGDYISKSINNICTNDWSDAFCTDEESQEINEEYFDIEIFKYFKFTPLELAKIENAFEKNANIPYYAYCKYSKQEIRADQIKGLEAVVKVMLELDENIEETYQEVFSNKALALAI